MNNFLTQSPLKHSQRLTLLLCSFLLCFIIASLLNALVLSFTGAQSMAFINASIAIQNIIAFTLPVIITVIFITNRPLQFLQVNRLPSATHLLLMIVTYFVMTPAMNWIVEWNASMTLPQSMHAIETWMRQSEEAATAVTDQILSHNNILLSITLVGLLTGFGEEFLFRGALQRILASRPMNIHLAIWISAFIFSAIHFQFFGFIPRLLLGAFFGYMAYWSGSLWTAIIAHAINNSTVVIAHAINTHCQFNLDHLGTSTDGSFPFLALASALITTVLIYSFAKSRAPHNP